MNRNDYIYSFFDNETSRIMTDVLQWNRSYSFTAANTFAYGVQNNMLNNYADYYPASMNVEGASSNYGYCTYNNSLSSTYYHALMLLYKLGAIPTFNGIFTLTSDLSSNLKPLTAHNYGMMNLVVPNDNYVTSSFTANYLYVFSSHKSFYGDAIKDQSFSAYLGSELFCYDANTNNRSFDSMEITHSAFTGSTTFAWLLRDHGKFIVYTDNANLTASLSALNRFDFDNCVYIGNTTVHITLNGGEYNHSENPSFYDKFYNTGKVHNTYISAIGLYNNQSELMATIKLATPIKKFNNLPITIKAELDYI
jgi:hypothetical protein